MPIALTILGWLAAVVAGLSLALFASTGAVRHTQDLVRGSKVPPFLVGITLLAVGTDLPEIANSLISCFTGHGDLNAGASIGSTVTQATLILGLLPFVAGGFRVSRQSVLVLCMTTMVALSIGALLMRDGFLSRGDGLILVLAWVLGSVLIWRQLPLRSEKPTSEGREGRARSVVAALGFLALVGLGSAAAVTAFAELAALLGMPEYILSFFLASIGTSLPELVVDIKALRSGLSELALGDVLGSSFLDASLSIGIGPVFFPAVVSAGLAVSGSTTAIVVMGLVALLMGFSRRHNRVTGAALIALYLGVYYMILA